MLSGKDGKDKGGSSSSSDSDDNKDDSKSSAMERKLTNMRRNIREVMSESQLDEETLAAQRQEMERLRRVQEQQRIIREVVMPSPQNGTAPHIQLPELCNTT